LKMSISPTTMNRSRRLVCAIGVVLAALLSGCHTPVGGVVPQPIDMLLPKEISIHPFTGTRMFDEQGGIKGMDVRIEAKDSFGDATKAFGQFRFEMYDFRKQNPDPKGEMLASWDVNLIEPKDNLVHWDNITRTYQFKLQWARPMAVGRRFVLVAVFSSPYHERLFAQREFTSGQ
jgi:hypothetical protein